MATINAANYNLAGMTSTGIVKYDGTTLVSSSTAKIDSSNRQTNSSQPAFSAYKSSTSNNVTGDSTTYTILFDTVIFDQASNYASGTGIFTAPVTGRYFFTAAVFVNGGTNIQNNNNIFSVVTTARSYNIYPTSQTTQVSTAITVFADMSVNDTAKITITLSDTGGKVDDVFGNASMNTYFSGYLVC